MKFRHIFTVALIILLLGISICFMALSEYPSLDNGTMSEEDTKAAAFSAVELALPTRTESSESAIGDRFYWNEMDDISQKQTADSTDQKETQANHKHLDRSHANEE